tara:strand:- start:10162 stop:11262 length:1101 start_codon:yes stop_codon:yes gene_type:complete
MDNKTKKNIDTILENVTREALMKYIPKKYKSSIKENDISLLKNKLLGDLLNEKKDTKKFPGRVETEKNWKESGKDFNDHMKAVAEKMKSYLDFKNNSHPEFPHQNNSKTDYESPMYRNSTEEEEFIDDFRGMGLQDANGVEDLDRLDDYLSGSQETGNAQKDADGNDLGNVVSSDLGKRIEKTLKRKKEKIADRKSKMSNLRGITPDVQTVTNLKESTDEEEINEFLAALARPAAAAVATYAGEKLIDKMVDEEAKPDFLDLDGDGDKEEPMKKAAKEKEMKEGKKKDHDGDGDIDSDDYLAAKDKAIKKSMGKEVEEMTGASSAGAFVAPLGYKPGQDESKPLNESVMNDMKKMARLLKYNKNTQ